MKLLTFRTTLALTLWCGGLQAANLLSPNPASVAVSCNTITGPGPAATVVVKPVTPLTNKTIAVTLGALSSGLVVTPPASAVLDSTNQAQGLTYAVNLAAGCRGAASGSASIKFYAGGTADVTASVTMDVTALASPLVASPVTITCARNPDPPLSYSVGPAQTVSVTSAAAGGTPFTVDTSTNPAWLAVGSSSGGIASSTGVTVTVSPVFPCGNYPSGSSTSVSIHLKNPPAPDGLIPVSLQIIGPSPLTATPAAPSLSYTKGSGTPASVDVALSAASAVSFSVDSSSLPTWLSVDLTTGTTPKSLHFTTTGLADAIAQGTYSGTVRLQVSGFADLALPLRLTATNPPPKLTVAEGTDKGITWAVGQPLPIPYITLVSSDAAIPYSIVTGGPLQPMIANNFLKGFAYSYGTPIPVTFNQGVFASAQPGDVLTGTVTVTWGTPAMTTAITIKITVQPAAATLLGVMPPSLPTAAVGQTFTVALIGTGFVASPDPLQATTVGIVSGGSLLADANIVSTVVNASNIILTITVPASADPLLPFGATGTGGTVNLGVCNPLGATCSAATGTAKVTIGAAPVIQAVTSASAFLQVSPPTLPTVAPYDMISVFGTSFCVSGGTGCTGSRVLYGLPDAVTLRYPSSLSPDAAGATQRFLTVTFQTHTTPPAPIANAPLLFATNGQINLVVPAAVAAYVGKTIDLVVNFGYPPATMMSSAPVSLNVAAADPGIFTIRTDGQGDGAILGVDWSIIAAGNEAAMRSKPADSDIIQIYMTGLGVPDSAADNAGSGTGQWPADCVAVSSYLTALNRQTSGSFPSVDGVLLTSGLLNSNRLAPCMRSAATIPTVTIGGQPATVTYAGWVADSVAGEYQVNVRLPGSAGPFTLPSGAVIASPLTSAVKLPVVVTARGRSSQPGVTIWVAPRLKVTGPADAGLHGAAGRPWSTSGNLVTASEGTPPYQYAVTSGPLPEGVTLDAATGAISGTPAAAKGSYLLTVTATDSAASPLTGSVTFTLTID